MLKTPDKTRQKTQRHHGISVCDVITGRVNNILSISVVLLARVWLIDTCRRLFACCLFLFTAHSVIVSVETKARGWMRTFISDGLHKVLQLLRWFNTAVWCSFLCQLWHHVCWNFSTPSYINYMVYQDNSPCDYELLWDCDKTWSCSLILLNVVNSETSVVFKVVCLFMCHILLYHRIKNTAETLECSSANEQLFSDSPPFHFCLGRYRLHGNLCLFFIFLQMISQLLAVKIIGHRCSIRSFSFHLICL